MIKGRRIVAFVANDVLMGAFLHFLREGIIDYVVTISRQKAQRAKVCNYVDVSEYVGREKIYYARKYSLKSEEDIRWFASQSFDIGLIMGWNRLIPDEVIRTFSLGIIGLHGTPLGLPKGRGRSPSVWAIALGFKEFYYHAFRLTPGVDDGPILVTRRVEILPMDTVKTFHMKLGYVAREMLLEAMERLIEGDKGRPQEGTPVYFRKRDESDGYIRWGMGADRVYNLVRAITRPYPGAWTWYEGEKVRIWWGVPFKEVGGAPGKILAVMRDGFIVGCGEDSFLVLEWEGPTPREGEVLT